MTTVDVVRCVDCPAEKALIPLPACYKCPHFVSHGGMTVNCGFERRDKMKEEKSIIGEPLSRW